jgi:hypothetical protein
MYSAFLTTETACYRGEAEFIKPTHAKTVMKY